MADRILIHPKFHRDAKGWPHFDIALVNARAPFVVTPPNTPRIINLPAPQANVEGEAFFDETS
jgi:hypothetical protein